MIEVYKILTNKYYSRVNLYMEKQQDSITRGHSLKLINKRCHYDLRKFSFAPTLHFFPYQMGWQYSDGDRLRGVECNGV